MAVTPFELNGQFTLEEFNSRIGEINDGYFDKEQTLTPEVAALYGLTPDAVPDDALAALAFANQYVWWRSSAAWSLELGAFEEILASSGANQHTKNTIYYTDSLSIDPFTGEIIPGTIGSVEISYSDPSPILSVRGKFWARNEHQLTPSVGRSTAINYSPEDAEYSTNVQSYKVLIEANNMIPTPLIQGRVVVYDPSPLAYEDGEIIDGYKYSSIGKFDDSVFFDNNVVLGSYTGTSTSGGTASQTIKLGFAPSVLVVLSEGTSTTSGNVFAVAPDVPTTSGVILLGEAFMVERYTFNGIGKIYQYIAWR